MPWNWEELIILDSQNNQYFELNDVTYADLLVARYTQNVWTELPVEEEGP